MKKFIISSFAAVLASSAFAGITETAGTDANGNAYAQFDIVGEASSSELASSTYNSVWLNGTLNFDGDRNITVPGQSQMGWGNYGFGSKGNSVLNFTGKGILTVKAGNSLTSAGGTLTINIAKGAGGIVAYKVGAYTTDAHKVVLNLDEEYAIRSKDGGDYGSSFYVSVFSPFELNMSANQRVKFDFRVSTGPTVKITDNALLIVDTIDVSSISAKDVVLTLDGGLENGAMLFYKTSGLTYDADEASITRTVGENSQVIRFVDTNGDKLLNLDIKEIDMNGRTYIAMTQVPEPAEWAAIFGAVALGLAACRRRK